MRKTLITLATLVVLAFPAFAQDFPNRTVKLVTGYTPGGGNDITGRLFAEKLSELWKQPVIVENKPGAGGTIAIDLVSKAPADGYTILIFANSLLISQVVYPNVTFDMMTDYIPLALVSNAPLVLAVNPAQIPAKDLKEFTAMIKAAPGKYAYSACNVAGAPHFAMEMYKHALGLDALHVPHKGCGPTTTDLVAGHINIGAVTLATALPFIRQGRLRAIAVISAARSPAAPDIPTMRESGIPELKDYSFENYYGFMVPKGTPPAVVQKLEADFLKVAAMPALREKVEGAGLDMYVHDAKAMRGIMRKDLDDMTTVARVAKIKAE